MEHARNTITSLIRYAILGGIAAVIAIMVLPVDMEFSRKLNEISPYVMVGFFGLGLFSLMARQLAVMKGSFIAVAIIAIMLRSSALTPVIEEPLPIVDVDQMIPSGPISVSQYSTSNLLINRKPSIQTILNSDADVLSISGLTPDWADLLGDSLAAEFPYHYLFEDIGVYGLGLFSKTALGSVDSILIGKVVQVIACVSGSELSPEVTLLAAQTTPPVNTRSYQVMKAQLGSLADYVKRLRGPLISIGDFNNMPWSNEMSDFQANANLQDSRRSQYPTYHEGAPHLFDRPVEHIFYSTELQCLQYRAQREGSTYIGSGATFQLRSTSSAMVAP